MLRALLAQLGAGLGESRQPALALGGHIGIHCDPSLCASRIDFRTPRVLPRARGAAEARHVGQALRLSDRRSRCRPACVPPPAVPALPLPAPVPPALLCACACAAPPLTGGRPPLPSSTRAPISSRTPRLSASTCALGSVDCSTAEVISSSTAASSSPCGACATDTAVASALACSSATASRRIGACALDAVRYLLCAALLLVALSSCGWALGVTAGHCCLARAQR